MARDRDSSTLTARQRLGLLIVLLGSLAAFCIMLWKSREHAVKQDDEAGVVITELQGIPPIHVDDSDSSQTSEVEKADRAKPKSAAKKRTKRPRAKKSTNTPQSQSPPRDITAETVSP